MRPDQSQLQPQYLEYVVPNMGADALARSNLYNSANFFSPTYHASVYPPNTDSPANYSSRASAGPHIPAYHVANHASGNRKGISRSVPPNKMEMLSMPVKTPDGSTKTNFKPTHTKKNSRPKINKLENDYRYSLRPSLEGIEEPSHDKIYENFRSILGISTPRIDINKTCEVQLESPL